MKSKKISTVLAVCTALLAPALAAPAAQAQFGLSEFTVSITDKDGFEQTQAGSHPFAFTAFFRVNVKEEEGQQRPDGRLRDAFVEQIAGFVGNATTGANPRCSAVDFITITDATPSCAPETAVGVQATAAPGREFWFQSAVYNLVPPPGAAARLAFQVFNQNVYVDVVVNPETDRIFAGARSIAEQQWVFGNKIQLWGNPSDPAHDDLRGNCGNNSVGPFPVTEQPEFARSSFCSESVPPRDAFLTLPTRCEGANTTTYIADRWENPAPFLASGMPDLSDPAWVSGGFASPQFTGCGKLGFDPTITAKPTSRAAQSATGLDFELAIDDPNLTSTEEGAIAKSHVRKAVVTLPEGMTANPSIAEGLEVCSQSDLGRETATSDPGEGCPEASKIGTIEVDSPLIDQSLEGSLYQATPFANLAGDSLIAFYMVMKNARLGLLVKQAVRVDPDPRTGQLVATADNIPQLPFSSFRLRFREGGRSPLITPRDCGTHTVEAMLHPWSGSAPSPSSSSFEIISGPNNGPCPSGSAPFEPGFSAGTLNNNAGSYSPFAMRLTRRDGDQDLVRFDAILPPGVLAKLAGVSWCSDAQIALAKAKTGKQELANPSCPGNSRIGGVWGGAGVGSQLTYVPGSVYLAGPFAGAPLSVVGVVPAVAGPFDIGTVVTQQALVVDPVTGIVRADGSRSDPIPHILAGIPLNVRDIQVNIDRPGFTLNPTSCDPSATFAGIWGGGNNVFSLLDDAPVTRAAPFQAASCSRLGFKPRLGLRLKGGTRRGANPGLLAVLRPRPGHANIERTAVRLPRSAFLDQAHIRTICTRVQFAADACPKGAIYGRVVAHTPLLDQPLVGPAYLRSSDNELPDLVFDLKGLVDIESAARIDSVRGGIRAVFAGIPDAPLTKVVVRMQGGKKGLIVNSRNLCRGKNRANVRFDGHNGARQVIRPVVRPVACKKRRAKRSSHRRAGRGSHVVEPNRHQR